MEDAALVTEKVVGVDALEASQEFSTIVIVIDLQGPTAQCVQNRLAGQGESSDVGGGELVNNTQKNVPRNFVDLWDSPKRTLLFLLAEEVFQRHFQTRDSVVLLRETRVVYGVREEKRLRTRTNPT